MRRWRHQGHASDPSDDGSKCPNSHARLQEDGANVDLDSQRRGKCVVLKTSTRQTIFLPVVGLVDADALKPADLVGVNKASPAASAQRCGHLAAPGRVRACRPGGCVRACLEGACVHALGSCPSTQHAAGPIRQC